MLRTEAVAAGALWRTVGIVPIALLLAERVTADFLQQQFFTLAVPLHVGHFPRARLLPLNHVDFDPGEAGIL